ncbi:MULTISPECIES: hypothetical protein [unclassified Paracoccus (in: a-proteobacteria)]|uniref:hypothetical protein n=1 Tax=unclassified Paracoccus (in: a-proteobacteria) TaxID=2688777 RepID=UPI001600EFB1|nr:MULTISPECIES: hypothetical protein [unclassified Paracoccus (in: a-proteobacteria)]MBB1491252.1 hypothetical protein [Paracoccus sp. MC1854]MBB1498032.1 hypothetical protein [Paracoccus sp. MC1862]QQO43524.1 hypothetical protein JGR78_08570 [Paracoccus sp. MC1862]
MPDRFSGTDGIRDARIFGPSRPGSCCTLTRQPAATALSAIRKAERSASEILNRFEPLPQAKRNVSVKRGRAPMERPATLRVIRQMTTRPGRSGRLVVRPSDTEPLVRVMAEGEDMIHRAVDEVSDVMRRDAMPGAESTAADRLPILMPISRGDL